MGSPDADRLNGLDRGRVRLDTLRPDDAWHADPLRDPVADHELRLASPGRDGWLRGAPPAFDVRHEATGRVVLAHNAVSPVILGDLDEKGVMDAITMGYTFLSIAEKRAVIAEGRIVRLWPQAFEREAEVPHWVLLIPDEPTPRGSYLLSIPGGPDFTTSPATMGALIDMAQRLSRLMAGRPILLVRILSSQNWH